MSSAHWFYPSSGAPAADTASPESTRFSAENSLCDGDSGGSVTSVHVDSYIVSLSAILSSLPPISSSIPLFARLALASAAFLSSDFMSPGWLSLCLVPRLLPYLSGGLSRF